MKRLFLLGLAFLVGLSLQAKKAYRFEHLYKNLEFEMPKIDNPAFPKRTVSVTDFGAVGNGVKLCTDAFAKAIDAVSSKGGGTVLVPAGVWFTGPIVFKSNVNLHLQSGAVILFSPDKNLYPLVETVFEGLDTKRCQSPVSGRNLVNVAITGKGAIDGNGHFWRPVKKEKVTENQWKKITSQGGAFKRDTYWMPSEQYVKGDAISNMNVPAGFKTDEEYMAIRDFLRPVMVSFINCKNVWLEGVIFQNSPAWNLHPLMCENVLIENVTVRNPSYSANGDGLDLESCKNSIVVNSTFDVGDDGICIKSGKDEDGRKRGRPCENLIVDNCTVFKGHGGFVVGSEMSGGVRNVKVSNCQFLGTDVGLRFKSNRGRGGVVENIYIENIGMFDISTEAVLFDLYYMGKSAVEVLEEGAESTAAPVLLPVTEKTPTFRNIFIQNIFCKNARRAFYFNGLPENPIDNIQLKNLKITSAIGAEIKESKNILLENIDIVPTQGPSITIGKCDNVTINNVSGEIKRDIPIDRNALVSRNNPHITAFDSLASFTVGNGEFAMTVDATGLQSFPQRYSKGVPLGTQSQWGWHSFANPENYKHSETLKNYNFRGKEEPYSVQFNENGRNKEAANWFRENPHRLHLGVVGFDLEDADFSKITGIDQTMDMWQGIVKSKFSLNGSDLQVRTACHPKNDIIGANITGTKIPAIKFHFPYPSGGHADDACDWNKPELHSTEVVSSAPGKAILKRTIDETVYFVEINWKGNAKLSEKSKNYYLLTPEGKEFSFTTGFYSELSDNKTVSEVTELMNASENYWKKFWTEGAAIDFSQCKDPRAKELERRVVLSQYLLAVQCAGSTPPQETGLTYNSWYGKFHLEMIWWHQTQFALWNRPELLERTLEWYFKAMPVAKEIAARQGFEGVRWMKMTDPSAIEAPSKVGSFLIWQQPHIIYLAELVYRANPNNEFLKKYAPLIEETAKFMFSFADYDMMEGRYVLKGAIPAQETLRASETVNPPFELSYWHFAMNVAQKWRVRLGEKRNLAWDEMIDKLSPLAHQDGLYLAAETALDTYKDIRFTSDHMAVLGAYGILPKSQLVRTDYMQNTLNWIWTNWNWGKTWGWDYPMTAMNAARLGDGEKAVGALLMDKRTNTYLPNGHNYQDSRLRVYLPGNGGLLTAVAMMCAGWDGCQTTNPGFPKDGNWDVKWEGLKLMP